MYCYHWYGETSRLLLRRPGSKNTTGCGDCLVFFSCYERDQIALRYQESNHQYWPSESWPTFLPFSFLSATPFLTVYSLYQTFPKWIEDRVPDDSVKRDILVESEGEILAVRWRVCCWCSETEKCSAFFLWNPFCTHSFQALAWLPTWDIPVTCCLKKKV